MYAGMRRVPAERARHAKRLGHVQVLARPDNETTTTTQQTTPTAASSQASLTTTPAIHSSSSAPTSSSSTTPSSSSATTSSVVLSTTTQSLTTVAPLSSTIIPPAVLTSTSPTLSSTPTPHSNATTSSGLSGGAIAGIVAGAVVVGAALIVFIVRKTYLRRRGRKHASWDGAPGLGADILDEPKPLPDISERPDSFVSAANTPKRIVPLSPFGGHAQSIYPVSPPAHMQPNPTFPACVVPTPPPVTYNNLVPVVTYPPHPVSSAYSSGNPTHRPMTRITSGISSIRVQPPPMEATVKCTFVPNLPDELSITTGERVLIIEQYDDGWDLCTNVRGERGMVPRECLEHVPIDQPGIGWKNVRTSSLNLDGKRF